MRRAHRFDGFLEMTGAAVGQIIARHGGDDDVPEAQALGGFGHAGGFAGIERERLGGGHRAKLAGAGAAVAANDERGGAFAPAFPMIRTPRTFANGVELQLAEQLACARTSPWSAA